MSEPFLSGMTIAYRAVAAGYPLAESLRSMLPICDEVVVNVGKSDDGTLEAVRAVGSDKIRILEGDWDLNLHAKGLTLSLETNRAKEACRGRWALYLQADEVLHEDDLPYLADLVRRLDGRADADGVSFRYLHFYGSPRYVQDHFFRWYTRAIRLVRNDPAIRSVGDALKFRRFTAGRPRRLREVRGRAGIFHYGWARPPRIMVEKQKQFEKFYRAGEVWERKSTSLTPDRIYAELGNLRLFTGTHPAVMAERVAASDWDFDARLDRQPPRWIRVTLMFTWYLLARFATKTLRRMGLRRTT